MLAVVPIQAQHQCGTGPTRIHMALNMALKTLAVGGCQWMSLE
jgi:hypothetical protein